MLSLGRQFARVSFRTYISRAHPKPIPEFPLPIALQSVLDDVEKRRQRRERRVKAITTVRVAKGKSPRERNNPDETIELAINLNLDPRKPGQALRGSVSLPHGTGKKGVNCIVFSSNAELQQRAKAAGALHAGGESLADQIANGEVPVDSFQATLATPEMIPYMSKKVARLLGPRGLMPNKKVGTIIEDHDAMLQALANAMAAKEVEYRTEKEGVVHVPIGKESFGLDKLMENVGAVMGAIFDAKPDSYGKGKKGPGAGGGKKGQTKSAKNQPKYLLKAFLCSTQGRSFRVVLRTIDPADAFFLTDMDPLKANAARKVTVTSSESLKEDIAA